MAVDFQSKVAIVTGGGSGIGRALGRELVTRGARVVLADVVAGSAEAAARQLGRREDVEGVDVDVRDAAAIGALVERVARQYGKLDLMFNNAGIGVAGMANEFALDDWMNVVDTNLRGVIHGTHAAYRVMVEQRDGHIVNTASLAGLLPVPGQISYCTTKHAIIGLSHALRIEGAPKGVRVSVACPARVDTPFFEKSKWINLDMQRMKEKIPGKPESPADCARGILRGVQRNDATIATGMAAVVWRMHRYAPFLSGLMQKMMYRDLDAVHREALAGRTSR